jgi:predicted peroxiredoxin
MSKDIVFLFGWGPEEDGRLSSLLYMVETARAMKMNVTVFLFTDAAVIAKKGAATKISEEIGRRFAAILKKERIEVYVCEEAAMKRGITQENLEDGLVIAGYATLLNRAVSSKAVVTI